MEKNPIDIAWMREDRSDARKRIESRAPDGLARRPVTLERALTEVGDALWAAESPQTLGALTRPLVERMTRGEARRLGGVVSARFGVAFARRAGLPVGRPRLQLAG